MTEIRIIRSARKTLAIQVQPSGQVIVRAPARLSRAQIEDFIQAHRDWILRQLKKAAERQAAREKTPPFTEQEIREMTSRTREIVRERAAYFARVLGVTYGRIAIRSQKTRWGSCSSRGNLNFNCLLALVPPEVRDYVVVHELCHRREMNHSPRFWAEVERVLPDYRQRKQWLSREGAELISRLEKSNEKKEENP